jgi:hypothetical protein
VFTESSPLHAAAQSVNEVTAGIQTAHAADKFAQRQRDRHYRRRAPVEVSAEDLERMVKDFVVTHGRVVMCPPAYAVRSDQYRT